MTMNRNFFPHAGFLQFEIVYGEPAANLEKIKKMLDDLAPPKNTLIALPELWASGFDYDHAEEVAGQTPDLLQELAGLAARWDIHLCGSLLERTGGDEREAVICNSLYFIGPNGVLGCYRKQHLFAFWQEDRHFSPGGMFKPVSTSFGLIGGVVCYDLRFPEIGRHQAFHGAQLFVVSAEWPGARIDHWQTLVQARAIENQVFVVACNSSGKTGEHELGGNSMVAGPDGTILLQAGAGEEAMVTGLNGNELTTLRDRFCPAGERPRPVRDSEKQVDLPELLDRLVAIRRQNSRIAFTNGCFDILHSGHAAYLEKARSAGDCLVVGLNSDRSVRAIKGPDRPVNPEQDRARILAALACVDYVIIFDEETPYNLITAIMPDILVKGADWAEGNIVGADEVRAAGGRVVRVAFEHNVSTSGLISRIQARD